MKWSAAVAIAALAGSSFAPSAGATSVARHTVPFRVPDQALYARLKKEANQRAHSTKAIAPVPSAPVTTVAKNGLNDPNWAPSDSNGAAGTGKYIEMVNNQVGIFSTSLDLLSQITLGSFLGAGSDYVTDPDVYWDPGTKKFYYTAIHQHGTGSNYFLAFGFSKSANPTGSASFCKYEASYGTDFPDYPKIGGTKNFGLIGTNNYTNDTTYHNSNVRWFTKPGAAALTTCPTVTTGLSGNLPFSTIPARQVDPSSTGYLLTATWSGGTTLQQRKVTKSSTGTPVFGSATSHSVTSYSVPATAPQPNGRSLDTLDNRLWQAIQATDPRLGSTVLWTSHTVFGGPGAAVRWYEFKPGTSASAQTGTVSSSSLYIFNGSISPDRVFRSSTVNAFGSNMVADFNTSSSAQAPTIGMVSKIGTNAQSAITTVISGGSDIDFSCPNVGNTCRWGDYSSATPDPNASTTGTSGSVVMTSMYASGGTSTSQSNWLTENWKATP
ncbi:MAG: hypothetical protein QOH48_1273 [Actinomycetota bacterium]|jgi:hypothetical protein|nr:hypothetical protein [Actinomycetota bacterium]